MKIPNYDPGSSKSNYKQGHPCMPADVFRMLICGPSNSGKTNTLLHMLYELLEYDQIYLFQKTCTRINISLFCRTLLKKSTPRLVMRLSRLIPLEELPMDNQKIVIFDDLVCEKKQNDIINYFINGRHKNCCVIYLSQTFYKVPKDIRVNCSHLCVFRLDPKENKRIANEIGVDHEVLDRATDEKYSFLYYDKPQKLMKKILMKIYNGVY